MRPPKYLCWPLLILTVIGSMGAVVSSGGRYPSPYVDDWSDTNLIGTSNTCNAALAACTAATGRAIFRAGTYKLSLTSATALPDSAAISGQGMGVTILSAVAGETGAGLSAGSDNTLSDLTLAGNDEATTTGLTTANGKHRVTCTRVEFKDFSTGCSAGNGVINGIAYLGCKWTSNVTGLSVAVAATGLMVDGGVFNANTTNGISLHGNPTGGKITGCTFVNEPTCINLASSTGITIASNAFLAGTTSIAVSTPVRCEIGDNYWAFDEIVHSDVTNKQLRLHGKYWGTASPSAGIWLTGDVVDNSTPGTSGNTPTQWVCAVGGMSGTWEEAYRGAGMLTASETWDPDSLDNGQSDTHQMTVTGSAVGDFALATHDQNLPNGFVISAQAIGSDLVDVTISNVGGGTQNVLTGTVYVRVIKQ